MKSVKDKEFDDLFKNRLKDAEFNLANLEDDWNDLENMLDNPRKRRGIVFWLPVLSSAAAILLLLGWWMFRPLVAPAVKPTQQVAVKITQPETITSNSKPHQHAETNNGRQIASQSSKVEQTSSNGKTTTSALIATGTKKTGNAKSSPRSTIIQNSGLGQNQVVVKNQGAQMFVQGGNTANNSGINQTTSYNNQRVNGFSPADLLSPALGFNTGTKNAAVANVEAKSRANRIVAYPEAPSANEKAAVKSNSVFAQHPQFALTVLGAPEVNGVGSFGDAKAGTNVGLMFSAGIFKKLTISTGANYAVMPYNTDVANYHTNYVFKTNPAQIEADCRALDIPINVDYQLYNKRQNKFSIGTGLSSYIMLHESYGYYYADPTTKGPSGYTVANHGKYLFGIANVQATYTRQVNSKFGISVQPYLKLPLTNIGYSQAKLQTAGVAVGLSWNINSLTKP